MIHPSDGRTGDSIYAL